MPTYILCVYTGNINNGRILWSLILAFFLIKCLGKGSHSDQTWWNTRIFTPGGPNLQYPFCSYGSYALLVYNVQHWVHWMEIYVSESPP